MSQTPEDFFRPSDSITQNANIKDYETLYKRSIEQREQFWADEATKLHWYKKWDTVLSSDQKPFYRWFEGGKFNIVANAIDRHVKTWRRNKLALIWEGENGTTRSYSYHALNREVCKFATILKSMGVKKGEIVTIYSFPENVSG